MEQTNDIPNAVKRAIVMQNLDRVKNTLYDLMIQARVADKVSDKSMKDRTVNELTKFEKVRDEYELILRELNEEKQEMRHERDSSKTA